MRKPATAFAIDAHNILVISLSFEQEYRLFQRLFGYESSKSIKVYASVSKKELRRIINSLDDFG